MVYITEKERLISLILKIEMVNYSNVINNNYRNIKINNNCRKIKEKITHNQCS